MGPTKKPEASLGSLKLGRGGGRILGRVDQKLPRGPESSSGSLNSGLGGWLGGARLVAQCLPGVPHVRPLKGSADLLRGSWGAKLCDLVASRLQERWGELLGNSKGSVLAENDAARFNIGSQSGSPMNHKFQFLDIIYFYEIRILSSSFGYSHARISFVYF